MVDRAFALFTGLFILFLGAGAVAAWLWLSDRHVAREPYMVVTQQSVSGLSPQSQVLFRGIPAGQTHSIRIDPDDSRNILIKIHVDQTIPITHGTYASLRLQGFTGLSQLELDDSGADPTPLPTHPNKPGRIPMRPSFPDKFMNSSEVILSNTEQLLSQLNIFIKEINQAPIQQILTNTETVTIQLNRVLDTLPKLSTGAQQTLTGIDELVSQLQILSRSFIKVITKTEQLTETGQAVGKELIHSTFPRTNTALEQLTQTTEEIRSLVRHLQQSPQSLLRGRQPPPPGPGEAGYRD
jgi:phospholipid/cholesterol/gamma-HCH transport system substrate-binding protein